MAGADHSNNNDNNNWQAQMTALFRRSDVNGDNVISANELVDCLKELNPAFDPTKAGTMLSSIDKDIDSVISFSEFQLFYWSFLHQQSGKLLVIYRP